MPSAAAAHSDNPCKAIAAHALIQTPACSCGGEAAEQQPGEVGSAACHRGASSRATTGAGPAAAACVEAFRESAPYAYGPLLDPYLTDAAAGSRATRRARKRHIHPAGARAAEHAQDGVTLVCRRRGRTLSSCSKARLALSDVRIPASALDSKSLSSVRVPFVVSREHYGNGYSP